MTAATASGRISLRPSPASKSATPKPSRRRRSALPKIEWNVHALMNAKRIRFESQLRQRLAEKGVDISISQLNRIINGKSAHIDVSVLAGLVAVLECDVGDLLSAAMPG